jgi:hypothetical protein
MKYPNCRFVNRIPLQASSWMNFLDEKEWDAAFDKSQEKLSKLAEKVRTDIREGRIRKMGFGRL